MKKITTIIPIICILVETVLSIIFLDFYNSNKYLQFKNYDKEFISIKHSNDVEINNDLISEIISLAQENNVILAKSNISNSDANIKNVYLSFNSIEQLNDFITKNFKTEKKTYNIVNSSDLFISTYNHNDENQIGIILDLLENNYYNYYTFENLLSNNGNLYGEYIVYYDNYENFAAFSNKVKKIVGNDINSNSSFNNLQNYILLFIFGSVVLLMLFYFIFQVYDSYYKAKNIGCMKLLGFDTSKIAKIMIRKRLQLYFIVIISVLFLSTIFVKNINLYQILFLAAINLLLILLTIFINYICVNIIFKDYQTSNILKKQNIAEKISMTSGKLKIVIICLLIVSVSLLFQSLSILYSNLKTYNNSKELLNYGIIYDFNADSQVLFDYEKHADLYSYILSDENLSTFYSEFSKFKEKTEEDKEYIKQSYEDGSYFEYASVDKNYLKKEKIIIYNLNNSIVNVDDIDGIFFLFPKSKKNKIDQFEEFYKKYSKMDYKQYNVENNFVAYLYEDQDLNSYRLDLSIKYVESPIVRVIDDSLRLSYLETPKGLSIFGNALTTGLKIEISNNKIETFRILEKHIIKSGLEDLIGINNFMSFYEYFNDEIQKARFILIVIVLSLILVLSIYVILSIQVISLYVKSEIRKVMVKYLLGFNKADIFIPVIKKNVRYNIFAFLVTALILYIINCFNLLLFFVSISIFLIIDYIILFLIIKFYDFSKVYIQLKGGNYD